MVNLDEVLVHYVRKLLCLALPSWVVEPPRELPELQHIASLEACFFLLKSEQ